LTAETQGWITQAEAATMFAKLLEEFDIEVDLARFAEDEDGGAPAQTGGEMLKDFMLTHPFFTEGE
jgi:hypothetical protein